jgi:carbon-monoxide dehydrogenase medium subunit
LKPAPFEYHAPTSLEEALSLLAGLGDEAKPLAGGQSLVPAMNFRLARPAVLVDLNRIAELAFVEGGDDGGLAIGAMTRQRAVERSELVRERAPLLHETMPWVAHPQIRNRGTIGGSLAHADPAAELPAIALALDARLTLRSAAAERTVAARDFYTGLFETALEPGDLLTAILIPALPPRTGVAFEEVSRRHGDYALVGAAAAVTLDRDGRVAAATLSYLSVSDRPQLADTSQLSGLEPHAAALEHCAATVADAFDPPGDIHASKAFRRHLVRVLGSRALGRAAERAAHHLRDPARPASGSSRPPTG